MQGAHRQRSQGYRRLIEEHRIPLGLFLIGLILLGFWWYEINLKHVCELSGGKWEKIGALKAEHCNSKTTDFGKNCSDSSECEGFCFVEKIYIKEGRCSEYIYFSGCVNAMENGEVVELCWR